MATLINAGILLCCVRFIVAQYFDETSCTGLKVKSSGPTVHPPSTIPITFEVTSSPDHPGSFILVTIRPKNDSRNTFHGIMIQARDINESMVTYGNWGLPPNASLVFFPCFGYYLGTIINANSDVKVLPLHLVWIPPEDLPPNGVKIVASFVEEDDIFWENILIEVLVDILPPTIHNCPGNISIKVEPGTESVNVEWSEPIAEDESGDVITTSNYESGSTFLPGVTGVRYNFTDSHGNEVSCIFYVHVEEDTTPQVYCPKDIYVTVSPGSEGKFVDWLEPTATNQSEELIVVKSHNPGQFFPVGNTGVTYIFQDSTGNFTVCSFHVNVMADEAESFFSPTLLALIGGVATISLFLFIVFLIILCCHLGKRRRPQLENNSLHNGEPIGVCQSVEGTQHDDNEGMTGARLYDAPAGSEDRYTVLPSNRGRHFKPVTVPSDGTVESSFSKCMDSEVLFQEGNMYYEMAN